MNRALLAHVTVMLLACVAAGSFGMVLRPFMDAGYLLPFVAAAALTAHFAGLWPALFVAGVGLLTGAFLVHPSGGVSLAFTAAHLGSSAAVAALVSLIIEKLRRDRRAAADAARQYAFRLDQAESLVRGAIADADARSRLVRERDQIARERDQIAIREALARGEADALRRRLELAIEAGGELTALEDARDILESVARRVVPQYADWCALNIVQGDAEAQGVVARVARLRPPRAEDAEDRATVEIVPVGDGARVLQTGEPKLYLSLRDTVTPDTDLEQVATLREQGLRSAVIAPLHARERVLGAIGVGRSDPMRPLDSDDLRLIEDLAARTAQTLSRLEYERGAEEVQTRYRGVFAGVPDAMLLLDAAGRCVDANTAAAELLGRPRDELLGSRVGEFPVAGPSWTAADRERFVHEGCWRGEMEVLLSDGSSIPVDVRVTAVALPTDPLYLAVLRDVSAWRPLERLRDRFGDVIRRELDRPRAALKAVTDRRHEEDERRHAGRQIIRPDYADRAAEPFGNPPAGPIESPSAADRSTLIQPEPPADDWAEWLGRVPSTRASSTPDATDAPTRAGDRTNGAPPPQSPTPAPEWWQD